MTASTSVTTKTGCGSNEYEIDTADKLDLAITDIASKTWYDEGIDKYDFDTGEPVTSSDKDASDKIT